MDALRLRQMGVAELGGADVFGGADPISFAGLAKLGWLAVGAVIVAVVADWEGFKDGCFQGYNEATH